MDYVLDKNLINVIDSGKAKSCKDIKDSNPSSVSGINEIEVDGEKLEIRCEIVGDQVCTVSLFLLFKNQ